ncbi:MAG: DUF2779 domain-containing protein [Burkholderiaceae bacterium]|nr:DUF2779 domain-containing protein [Burkholderiaceae bacterium]
MRADILLAAPQGWTLAEVKSSGAVKAHHPTDVAIQRWVIDGMREGSGLRIARTELWRVDTDWTYRGDGRYDGLLVRELPGDGAVIAYNAQFERGVIERLADVCPELASALRGIAGRLFDLLPVVRAHYYHPDMRGSRSIKAVLPTIGTGLRYDELDEVQDGTAAQAAYLEAVAKGTGTARRGELDAALRIWIPAILE